MTMHVELDNWQKEALNYKGHLCLCTGRQSGKTFLMARKASDYMLKHPNCTIIVVSLTEDQAELMIIMILDYLEKNHKNMIGVWLKKPTKKRVYLTNGAMVLARPVGNTGDAVRGFTGDVLIIDEASRMPELAFTAAKPTLLTTGGEIWMCSTPYGKTGYFYECYLNKNNRFKVIKTNSEKVMKNRQITKVWTQERREGALRMLEEEKKDMPDLVYAQEYLGEFIDDFRQLFNDELIAMTLTLPRGGLTTQPSFNYSFLGVDIARLGEDEGTYEAVTKLDNGDLHHSYHEIQRKKRTDYTFKRIVDLQRLYRFKEIGIDAGSGSLGVGVLDFLLKEPTTKRRVIDLNNRSIMRDHKGKSKGKLLKEGMYYNLLMLMQQGRIKLMDDDDVRLSLKSVQYEYVRKQGQPTKIRIFGRYTHIVEGLVRAAWLANQKHLKLQISYI